MTNDNNIYLTPTKIKTITTPLAPVKKKKKKESKRCKNCRKKKGVYLILCKCCNKKFCISCLDIITHNCKNKDEYLKKKREKLECELVSADSNFSKIDKI